MHNADYSELGFLYMANLILLRVFSHYCSHVYEAGNNSGAPHPLEPMPQENH